MYTIILTIFISVVLGIGIIFSGTISRVNIRNISNFGPHKNQTFLMTLTVGIALNMIWLNLIQKFTKKPILGDTFEKNIKFKGPLSIVKCILGSVCLGFGWGIGNISASSLFMNLQFCVPHLIFIFFTGFILGELLGYFFGRLFTKCSKPNSNDTKRKNK
jgi:hypothetical protein